MCILLVKPKGKACPSKEILAECFVRNPDGAGFSYNKNGSIVLRKGFMNFADFYEATKKIPVESTALIHCRIGTSGGNTAGLTHPYPLCNDYKKMQKTTLLLKPTNGEKVYSVAHNGIFSELEIRKDVNDTCVFVANILNPLKEAVNNILDEKLDSVISRCVDSSRIAILDNDGNCKMYGSGWIEDCGIYYSNSTYRPYRTYYDEDYIWDKDCFYKYNQKTDSYDRQEYDSYQMSNIIKEYGSWKNFSKSVKEKEEREIEDLKLEFPEYEDEIDYYLSQGLTVFQIRQWMYEDYLDDYYTNKAKENNKSYNCSGVCYDEDDFYYDGKGGYRLKNDKLSGKPKLEPIETERDCVFDIDEEDEGILR